MALPKNIYDRRIKALRLIILFWLLGWFIKAKFFLPYFFIDIVEYPIYNMFFPPFFSNSLVAQIAYCLPAVIFFALLKRDIFIYKWSPKIMAGCSLILLLHQDAYNDATFLTSFWVGIYCWWFVSQLNKSGSAFDMHACALAQLIVAMIFLGGFVGKLTQGYWQGDVFYNIFFVHSPNFPFTYFREHFTIIQQQNIAQIFSRIITAAEGLIALGFIIPVNVFSRIVPFILLLFMATNTWRIISVLSSLIGLIAACRVLTSGKEAHEETHT